MQAFSSCVIFNLPQLSCCGRCKCIIHACQSFLFAFPVWVLASVALITKYDYAFICNSYLYRASHSFGQACEYSFMHSLIQSVGERQQALLLLRLRQSMCDCWAVIGLHAPIRAHTAAGTGSHAPVHTLTLTHIRYTAAAAGIAMHIWVRCPLAGGAFVCCAASTA